MIRAFKRAPQQLLLSLPKPAFQTLLHGGSAPKSRAAMTGEASFKEGGEDYRDEGKTDCFEGECSLTMGDSDPTFWGEPKLH